jgi:THO complex subunit 7
LENDMTTINVEHETQTQLLKAQKASLDSVITELASLRFVGKEREGSTSSVPSPRASPGPEGVPESIDADLVPDPLTDSPRSGDEGSGRDLSELDIEMGEVDEGIKEVKGKKKAREEMEEGEATDGSSEISEPPHGDL